ncbi:zinc finger protein 484-like [Sphaerodactylus townsendi]|uniref:Uncharacterized protein n=1 Tax=Sphaerodactylus townsendi TaxID=933632 RepID=A0ACB8FWB9_9SAUR|nr:zinc finger protein 484-like [Sphaerodactylus townsendi]
MAAEDAAKVVVTFEDVVLYFSLEEWAMLTAWQRHLYQEVMEDNFDLVASLGSQMLPKPELICKMEQGGEPCALGLPGQGGMDACRTPISATGSPSAQDPATEDWRPLVSPNGAALAADASLLKACPSWSESKLPDAAGSASPGPWAWKEGRGSLGAGSLGQAELQICECGRSFEDMASLCEHQGLHREEKGPFTCTSCGKLFQHHLNLLSHKKHRGKKRHACPGPGGPVLPQRRTPVLGAGEPAP